MGYVGTVGAGADDRELRTALATTGIFATRLSRDNRCPSTRGVFLDGRAGVLTPRRCARHCCLACCRYEAWGLAGAISLAKPDQFVTFTQVATGAAGVADR